MLVHFDNFQELIIFIPILLLIQSFIVLSSKVNPFYDRFNGISIIELLYGNN